VSVLTAHPIGQFRKNPNFYLMYDGFWFLVCVAVLATFWATGFTPVFSEPQLWWAAAAPVLFFGLVWAHLTVHNCTHGNLPHSINRIVGEILGILVVVRFASWDIIHMRHHKYTDDRVKDPHPNFPSFWKTVFHTVVNVEQQLFQQYFDTWGDTPENRAKERRRAWMSYGTNIVLVAVYAWLLGPWFSLLVFVPCELLAGLFVIHFNWSTHNGEAAKSIADMRPTNLTGPMYRLGNKLFAGIYAHALHHDRPGIFNPARALAAGVGQQPVPAPAADSNEQLA
jgi:fatty acid desaturase